MDNGIAVQRKLVATAISIVHTDSYWLQNFHHSFNWLLLKLLARLCALCIDTDNSSFEIQPKRTVSCTLH